MPDSISEQLNEECRDLPPGTLPHDAMNKAIFAHAEVLESFLRHYVDEDFIKDLDLTHFEPLPTEFVTEALRKRYSDCIRKIRWKGQEAYLLLILEFQSTKDVWIPVRILAYTALLWLDLIKKGIVSREGGLPPVFPIVIHSGSEKWNDPLSVQALLAPHAKALLKFQPQNLALLIEEKVIKDELLDKNSDFYALYLQLKRAKTPMAMRDAIRKYRAVLSKPAHRELLKTILAILETLYRSLNPDAGGTNVRFESLEEAVTMLNNAATNWKENTIAECLPDWRRDTVKERLDGWRKDAVEERLDGWRKDTVEEMKPIWKKEFEEGRMSQVAKKLASMGLKEEQIANATGMSPEEIRSLIQ